MRVAITAPGTGGTHVLIRGANLCQATGANFGTVPAAAIAVDQGVSTTGVVTCSVAATSPPGSGVVDVTVTSADGTNVGAAWREICADGSGAKARENNGTKSLP